MKTRIIHTKIYFQDDWFNSLDPLQKFLFIYLFTNEHIGMTGIYELSDRVILTETGLTQEQLNLAKKKFQKRVIFHNGWVCVVNSKKYADYSGRMNDIATAREISMIPKDIFKKLADTLSIPYTYPTDTTINKKLEIRNKKQETINHKRIEEIKNETRKRLKKL